MECYWQSATDGNSVYGFMPLVQVLTIVSVEMNEIFMSTRDISTEARKKPTRERYVQQLPNAFNRLNVKIVKYNEISLI